MIRMITGAAMIPLCLICPALRNGKREIIKIMLKAQQICNPRDKHARCDRHKYTVYDKG